MTDRKAEKVRLRMLARAARRRLSPAERRHAAHCLAAWAPEIARLAQRRTVSCFSAFGDELDTAPLIAALVREGCRLALPVVTGRGRPLTFRRWRPGDATAAGPFGIREPLPDSPEEAPGVFLVPLLGFDRRGFRIGYGGGFYDRTLAGARASRRVAAIGLAFACQEVARVPIDRYDEPVDHVLTERGRIDCGINRPGGTRASSLSW